MRARVFRPAHAFTRRNSARLPPLYRINTPTLHPLPSLDRGRGQVAIERVLVGPVINDDQRAVTDECVRVPDRARVHRADGCPERRRDLDAVTASLFRLPAGRLPESAGDPAYHWPVECATKRSEGHTDLLHAPPPGEGGHRLRQPRLRQLQLAGELRSQVAALVDSGH